MYKVIVFDLGGTLMEYEGMPECWSDYYTRGFEHLKSTLGLNITKRDIEISAELLEGFNPRLNYREIEYTPEYIFREVTRHWNCNEDVSLLAEKFYEPICLKATVFEDVETRLSSLKNKGLNIAALTDLPTAMPDSFFKCGISDILKYLDLYVSSLSCGFRKPNKRGLETVMEHFGADKKDILFIGDEEKDYKTAINFGCDFLILDRYCRQMGLVNEISSLSQLDILFM